MNTIVKVINSDDLPPNFRDGIASGHQVRITIEDLGILSLDMDKPHSDVLKLAAAYKRRLKEHPELVERDPVARIRALRDEWD